MMQCCKRSSSSFPSSAEIVGANEDLLTEILLFLPAKPLIRFQLVCKQWQSLIFAPSFVRLHTTLSRLQHSLLIRHPTSPSHYFYLGLTTGELVPFCFPFPNTKIVQSSHGFLLLESRMYDDRCREYKDYYVYNPTTNRSRKLPLHEIDGWDEKKKPIVKVCLVCDPWEMPDTYKVVCFWSMKMVDDCKVDVYDSQTHTWESLELADDEPWKPPMNRMQQGYARYWNDAIYWIRLGKHSDSFCFDLITRCFYLVQEAPTFRKTGPKRNHIFESNGYMFSALLFSRSREKYLHLSMMNKDCLTWSTNNDLLLDLEPIEPELSNDGRGSSIRLLGMIIGDVDEDYALVFHVPGKIIIYRFANCMFEVLIDFRSESYCWSEDQVQFDSLDTIQFVETLAPV